MKKSILLVLLVSIIGFLNTAEAQSLDNKLAPINLDMPLSWRNIIINDVLVSCNVICESATVTAVIETEESTFTQTTQFDATYNQVSIDMMGITGEVSIRLYFTFVEYSNYSNWELYTYSSNGFDGTIVPNQSVIIPVHIHAHIEGGTGY